MIGDRRDYGREGTTRDDLEKQGYTVLDLGRSQYWRRQFFGESEMDGGLPESPLPGAEASPADVQEVVNGAEEVYSEEG